MNNVLPTLIVESQRIRDFMAAVPCYALGLVEEGNRSYAFQIWELIWQQQILQRGLEKEAAQAHLVCRGQATDPWQQQLV